MKRKLIVIFAITVLIINTFSVSVSAAKKTEKTTPQTNSEETASEKLTNDNSNEKTLNNGSNPSIPSSMVVNENDMTGEVCVTLNNFADNEYVLQFKKERKYPFIIDLTSYDNTIDSIMLPHDFSDILIVEEKTTFVTDDTENSAETDNDVQGEKKDTETEPIKDRNNLFTNNKNEPVVAQTDDIVLKVITENTEYSWKSSSLKNAENINGFLKIRCASADQIMQYKTEETDVLRNKSDLKFEPKDEKNRGVLFVSEDDEGYWNITGEYLFESIAAYVISIIFLVVLNFALIIAVNLIIIKIYKMKK